MIAQLHGTVHFSPLTINSIIINVNNVGYAVYIPHSVRNALQEKKEYTLAIHTLVKEDRLDLFGFMEEREKALFIGLIAISGIGPKTALEILNVSSDILIQAITEQEPNLLKGVKGIGPKTAQKLLLELKNLTEKHPHLLQVQGTTPHSKYDQDAIDALAHLGYDTSTILEVLKNLPEDLCTTEQRVTHALRTL